MRLNSCQIWVSLASGDRDRRQEEGAGQREAHGENCSRAALVSQSTAGYVTQSLSSSLHSKWQI